MSTIMIVDDEPVILDVLSRLLSGDGRILMRADSAARAVERAAAAETIDVALIDKNLGDGSGLDVARELKRMKPDVEVILITGYASVDSAIEAVQIGAFDYVTKPISDYDALNLKIENAIEKVRMKRQQRALVWRLQESEERYRGVFEASSDAILLFDERSGQIADGNPAALRLYGFPPDELRGRRVIDLFDASIPHPDLSAAGLISIPAAHVKKDGTIIPVEITVSEGTLDRRSLRVCSVRDVSERERADQERRRLEENLRQAQKMEAIGRLAGGVAHDFSNILAVILGYSELIARDLPPGESRMRECAAGIVEAANRAVGVTRQLLTVSRKKLLHPEILSLNRVVSDLGKLLSRAIGERIELTTNLGPDLWPVEADADQLAQVLLNLSVNARDAMPEGGSLAIETANVELDAAVAAEVGVPSGRYIALRVRDAGCGMTEDVRSRIFEPFFTTKEAGTGLGLATVYGIARQAGGGIGVESQLGRGTTFTVYLPAAADRPEGARPRAASPPARNLGETVLLAEDEDALRKLIGRALAAEGYRVIEGRDGREALIAARGHGGPIHLLLTDLVMPHMSGQQLAEHLAADQPGMKVLFMTGHTDDPAIHSRLLDGGVEVIQKPFTSEVLLGHVRRLLESGPGSASPGHA